MNGGAQKPPKAGRSEARMTGDRRASLGDRRGKLAVTLGIAVEARESLPRLTTHPSSEGWQLASMRI
jgi:hypothetical protein